MQTYPPRREGDRPMSDKEDAYTHAKEVLEGDQKDERMHVVSLQPHTNEKLFFEIAFPLPLKILESP